jgi:hypothetical protein
MLTAAMSTLASNAIGFGMAAVLILLLCGSISRSRRLDDVSWADFERQFAEYVANRAGGAPAQMRHERDRADPPRKDRPERPAT